MANTLKLLRDGAVGFIDWLGLSGISEVKIGEVRRCERCNKKRQDHEELAGVLCRILGFVQNGACANQSERYWHYDAPKGSEVRGTTAKNKCDQSYEVGDASSREQRNKNCRISEPQIGTYRSHGENSEEDRVKTPENLAYVAHRSNEKELSHRWRQRAPLRSFVLKSCES